MATNRFSLIAALTIIAAFAALTVSMVTQPRRPAVADSISSFYDQIEQVRADRYEAAAAQQAYADQRRGEWQAGQSETVQQASMAFRQAEQIASAADAERAYLAYREGEWNAGVSPAQAYLSYRRGEWTGK